jgi:hypothetical protein
MELEKKTNKIWNTPERINSILSKYGIDGELDATSVVDLNSVFVDVEVRIQKRKYNKTPLQSLNFLSFWYNLVPWNHWCWLTSSVLQNESGHR